jgi:hypothetical protein
MGSFLSGLFTGSNPTLQGDQNNAGGIEGFGTSVGEGDIGNASSFYNDLLAGDPAKTAQVLAPQISNITGQGQQQKKTISEFGNRSGGTNSQAQTIDDTTRANIDKMVSTLTGQAAAGDASLGTSTLATGLTANQVQADEALQQQKNQQSSLLGGLISGGVSAAGDALTGGISGLFSGGGSDPYETLYNAQHPTGSIPTLDSSPLTALIGQ